MKSKILVAILLFLILSVALIATEKISVSAQELPEIYVLNPLFNPLTKNGNFTFYTSQTTVGDRFNATVWVSKGTNVSSWEVGMTYNATLLNATGAWVPKHSIYFPEPSDPEYIFYAEGTFTTEPVFQEGKVLIGDVTSPFVGVNFTTPKKLAIIEFKILLPPPEEGKVNCDLAIDNADTYLLSTEEDEFGNLKVIPTSKIKGYYEYIWLFSQLKVEPQEYITQKLETFNVNITLNNIEASQRVIGVQFWLHYNATLLDVLNVAEGPFLAQFPNSPTSPYTFFYSVIENQTIKVAILMLPNATSEGGEYSVFPQGNGTLATVTFKGLYQGRYPEENNCSLALTDIELINDSLKEINTVPPINGFYKILPLSPSAISITVNPNTIEFGSNATLSGVLSRENLTGVTAASVEDVNVTIYKRLVTSEWTKLTTATTITDGEYTYDWIPDRVGTFEFKANWTGDDTTLPAESSTVSLTVNKTTSEISLNVNPQTLTSGLNVTITGSIRPKHTEANITISYKLANVTAWSVLAIVKTGSNGNYSYPWKTSQAGTYEIKASWPGDENATSAESGKKTVVVEAPVTPPPEEEHPPDNFLYILIAVIAIIAVALTLYYYYRKTRKSKQAPQLEAPSSKPGV